MKHTGMFFSIHNSNSYNIKQPLQVNNEPGWAIVLCVSAHILEGIRVIITIYSLICSPVGERVDTETFKVSCCRF